MLPKDPFHPQQGRREPEATQSLRDTSAGAPSLYENLALSAAPRAPVTSSEGSCPLLGGMLPEAESLNKASVIFKFAPFNFRCLNVGRKN